ncbi:hypothetical protein, partial [Pantoea sp.]|uniref:hypothetical protein n=1 Tax=Pantoea sp. TaxID=69393 RepID=UPI0028ADC7AE
GECNRSAYNSTIGSIVRRPNMLPPAILLESRLLILASPRIIRKSAQEATRVLFLTLFSGGIFMAAIAKRARRARSGRESKRD